LALLQRAAQAAAILTLLVGRALARADREGIARVQTLVLKICVETAAQLVCSGASQDVDPARRLIVFRRERILLNADLANRFLRRHVSTGEAIDENLSTVRSCRWSGERLKSGREFVR